MDFIYHITSGEQAADAEQSGTYLPREYEADGFIHCSYAHQLVGVANANFRGRDGMVLLAIDRGSVPSRVIDENLECGEELFPHIYAPLPMAAVVKVYGFSTREDGMYELPEGLPA